MKILGIETATAICSVAIVNSGGPAVERGINSKQMHSEKILTLIDECLTEAKTTLGTLDGIAVSIGPGSFTGLRIGLSVAKGLTYSNNLPICGIPTLHALAHQTSKVCPSNDKYLLIPMIDARRDEVYCALYQYEQGELSEILPPRAATLDIIPSLTSFDQRIVVIGDGAGKFQEFCKKTAFYKSSSYIFPLGAVANCNAVPVAELGTSRLKAGPGDPIAALEPLYVKEFFTTMKDLK
jgi:tRNA threonylcarbamoyladenosine biosynthesis protein TsaB